MKTSEKLIQALREERGELLKKLHRLEEFLISDDLKKIDNESINMLWEQWAIMRAYERTLRKRIAHETQKQYKEEEKKE